MNAVQRHSIPLPTWLGMINKNPKESNPDSLWEWVDGSKLDYSNWSQDSEKGRQPSYCCPENEPSYCGTLGSNGKWFDRGCIEDPIGPNNHYICQKEKEDPCDESRNPCMNGGTCTFDESYNIICHCPTILWRGFL